MPQQERLSELLQSYISNQAGEEALRELLGMLNQGDYEEEQLLQLMDSIAMKQEAEADYDPAYWQPVLKQIFEQKQAPVISVNNIRLWRRIAVAASVLLIMGLASYFIFFREQAGRSVPVNALQDIPAPQQNRAVITLADGSLLYLDSVDNGTLFTQQKTEVIKTADGKIVYVDGPEPTALSSQLLYNTLHNPRGSKVIDITLSDGSRVWLNAGSSVTYPVAFTGNERKVSVNGEAYFEISHDKSKPFYVNKDGISVQVLGTQFNVNAYDDESEIKVTLLTGLVNVKSENGGRILERIIQPGQQAQIAEEINVTSDIDLEEVMAWKNGRFQFEGTGLEEMMRQVARWYDVEIVYEVKPKSLHFSGGISREVPASKVFQMMETTGAVHFRIEDRKVFVVK